jgi:hypothetical protein
MWNEFFHHYRSNDIYEAEVHGSSTSVPPSASIITNPVYLVPMISFHPGHILVDLLESVFNSMMDFYGEIPVDAEIILDVAGRPEREVLDHYVQSLVSSDENLASIVRFLTSGGGREEEIRREEEQDENEGKDGGKKKKHRTGLFVVTDLLRRLQEQKNQSIQLFFTDLHIGANIFHSGYYSGYRFHPSSLFSSFDLMKDRSSSSSSSFFNEIQKRYQRMKNSVQLYSDNYYNSYYQKKNENDEREKEEERGEQQEQEQEQEQLQQPLIDLLIIQRSGSNRVILNLVPLLSLLSHSYPQLTWTVTDLALLSFPEQLSLFKRTRVFLAVAGTALHNVLWLVPGQATVVMVLPPLWGCSSSSSSSTINNNNNNYWGWLYENYASLAGGIPVYPICSAYNESSGTLLVGTNRDHSTPATTTLTTTTTFLPWTRKNWLQPPRISKSANITVPVEELKIVLDRVFFGEEEKGEEGRGEKERKLEEEQQENIEKSEEDEDQKESGTRSSFLSHQIPGVTTTSSTSSPLSSSSSSFPLLLAFVSSLSVTEELTENNEKKWTVSLEGDFFIHSTSSSFSSSSVVATMESLFRSSPHLSVCVKPLLFFDTSSSSSSSLSFCHSLSPGMNYYSTIRTEMIGPTSCAVLRVWLSLFPGPGSSTSSGAVRGSETLVPLDCSLPECGFFLFRGSDSDDANDSSLSSSSSYSYTSLVSSASLSIPLPVKVFRQCRPRPHSASPQEFLIAGGSPLVAVNKEDEEWIRGKYDCSSIERIVFHLPARGREGREGPEEEQTRLVPWFELFASFSSFCRSLSLHQEVCQVFVQRVFHSLLLQWIAISGFGLPPLQFLPTERNPFTFLHVDKSGGTTLRE